MQLLMTAAEHEEYVLTQQETISNAGVAKR
jgi:hypothetical protein